MSEPQKENVFNFVYVDEEELTQSYNSIQRERRKLKEEKVWEAFCQDDLEKGLDYFKDDHCELNVPNSALNADKLLEGIENIKVNSKVSLTTVEESENEIDEIKSSPKYLASDENISAHDEESNENTTNKDITGEYGEVTYPDDEDDERSISEPESDESSSSDCNSECNEDHDHSGSDSSKYSDSSKSSDSSKYSNSSNGKINQEIIVEVHAEDTDEVIHIDCCDNGNNENRNENVKKKSISNRLETDIYKEISKVEECESSRDRKRSSVRDVADSENNSGKSLNLQSSEINVSNKYYAQAEKIAWTREKIVVILKSVLAYEENMKAVECSDDSDTGRLRKRAGEFAKRFARNYVYQPQRQLEELKKSMKSIPSSSQVRIQITTIVELHQSLLKALQEYKRQVGRLGETGTDLACHTVLTLLSKADEVCRRVVDMHRIPELQHAFKHDMQPLVDSILCLLGDTTSGSGSSASSRAQPRSQTSSTGATATNTATKANVTSLTQTRDIYTKQQPNTTPMPNASPVKRNGVSKSQAKSSKVDLSMYTMNTPWPESPVKKTYKQNKPSPKIANNVEAKPKTASKSKLNISQSHYTKNIPQTHQKQTNSQSHHKQNTPHSFHKHQSDTKPASRSQSFGYKQYISQSTQKLSKKQSHHENHISQSKSLNIPHSHNKHSISNFHRKQIVPSCHSKPNITQKQLSHNKVPPILLPNQSPGRSPGIAADRSTSRSGTDKPVKKFRSCAKVKSDRSVKTMVSEIEIEEPELELNEVLSPQLHQDVGQVFKWFKSTEMSVVAEERDNHNVVEEKRSGAKNAQLIIVKENPNSRKLEINLENKIWPSVNQHENSLTEIPSIDILKETAMSSNNEQTDDDLKPLRETNDRKSAIKLQVPDSEWKKAHQYREKYVKTLVDSPMYNAQFKKPWELVGRMSDTMVDELLQKVVLEMQDDIVEALCHTELE